MLPLLIPIITSLVGVIIPKLVSKAEVELPTAPGAEKKKWVLEFFNDLQAILESRGLLTPTVSMTWDAIEPMLSDLIENAVEQMKKKKA